MNSHPIRFCAYLNLGAQYSSLVTFMSSAPETPLAELPQRPPPIDKGPLRPAPTQAYDFRSYVPQPRIQYIKTPAHAKLVLDSLPQSRSFGFDLEWRPTYTKGAPENPVALVQLANEHSVLLFQVSSMKRICYPSVNQNRL
jgi:hypothetical protein